MKSVFYKISGAGNTFCFTDWAIFENEEELEKKNLVRRVCDPVYGVSCDGMVFIRPSKDSAEKNNFDFIWDFYNSDGSEAEMCGNAIRCAALYCREVLDFLENEIRFKTIAGLVTVFLKSSDGFFKAEVLMPQSKIVDPHFGIQYRNLNYDFFRVDTGVPHLVLRIDHMDHYNRFQDLAVFCRSHPSLSPNGSNVTFYEVISDLSVRAVTFERGVEGFTLACGTGATAAALAHRHSAHLDKSKNHNDKANLFINVEMPGGLLGVEINLNEVKLVGSARLIAKFEIPTEVRRESSQSK